MEASLSSPGLATASDVDENIRSRWAALPPDPVPEKVTVAPKRRALTPAALKAAVVPKLTSVPSPSPRAAPKQAAPRQATEAGFLPVVPVVVMAVAAGITGLLMSVFMGPAWAQGAGAFGAGVIMAFSLVPLRRTEGCTPEILAVAGLLAALGSLGAYVLCSLVLVGGSLGEFFTTWGLVGLGLRTVLVFAGVRAGIKATKDDTLDFA